MKKRTIFISLVFVFASLEMYAQSQNSVEEFSYAPGLISGKDVKLPHANLQDTKKVYGKGHHGWRPSRHGRYTPRIPRIPGLNITSSTSYPTTWTTDVTRATTNQMLGQAKREVFIVFNFEQLEEEMAQGEGERLKTLAHLYGCPESASPKFGKMTQNSYTKLFQNPNELTSNTLETKLRLGIKKDKDLSSACMIPN